jgi:hypothetical protein
MRAYPVSMWVNDVKHQDARRIEPAACGRSPSCPSIQQSLCGKALKAAHPIKAAPQRIQRKHAAGEEPITARMQTT